MAPDADTSEDLLHAWAPESEDGALADDEVATGRLSLGARGGGATGQGSSTA